MPIIVENLPAVEAGNRCRTRCAPSPRLRGEGRGGGLCTHKKVAPHPLAIARDPPDKGEGERGTCANLSPPFHLRAYSTYSVARMVGATNAERSECREGRQSCLPGAQVTRATGWWRGHPSRKPGHPGCVSVLFIPRTLPHPGPVHYRRNDPSRAGGEVMSKGTPCPHPRRHPGAGRDPSCFSGKKNGFRPAPE